MKYEEMIASLEKQINSLVEEKESLNNVIKRLKESLTPLIRDYVIKNKQELLDYAKQNGMSVVGQILQEKYLKAYFLGLGTIDNKSLEEVCIDAEIEKLLEEQLLGTSQFDILFDEFSKKPKTYTEEAYESIISSDYDKLVMFALKLEQWYEYLESLNSDYELVCEKNVRKVVRMLWDAPSTKNSSTVLVTISNGVSGNIIGRFEHTSILGNSKFPLQGKSKNGSPIYLDKVKYSDIENITYRGKVYYEK